MEVTRQPPLVTRSKQFIAQTSEEYVKAIYQLVGEMTFNSRGSDGSSRPRRLGVLGLYATLQPDAPSPTHDQNTWLVLQLPKCIFCARLPNIEVVTGYALSSKTGLGKVTYNFIQSTLREIAGIKPESAPPLAETLVDLLSDEFK